MIRDRQYTAKADGLPRRSAQTALYHIAEALTRWIAPILSFTAEELWKALPGEHSATVFTEEWYQGLTKLDETKPMNSSYWTRMMDVRSAVAKELEKLRNEGVVKGSLTAKVSLYAEDELYQQIHLLENELRFVLITSYAEVNPLSEKPESAVESDVEGLWINAGAAEQPKCGRCWHHQEDVGSHSEDEALCQRCIDNVYGEGESRQFA